MREKPGQLKLDLFVSYIALHKGPVLRSSLRELFWPADASGGNTGALRQAIATVKRIYGEHALSVGDSKLVGVNVSTLQIDAVIFKELVERGSYAEALAWYTDDFFAGLRASDVPADPSLDAWLNETRDELKVLAAHAELELAKQAFRESKVAEAAHLAWTSYKRVDGVLSLDTAEEINDTELYKSRFALYYNLIIADPSTSGSLSQRQLEEDAAIFEADDRSALAKTPEEALALLRRDFNLTPLPKSPVEELSQQAAHDKPALTLPKMKPQRVWLNRALWCGAALAVCVIIGLLVFTRLNNPNARRAALFVDTFASGLANFYSDHLSSWTLAEEGSSVPALCGSNRSREDYTYLLGKKNFTGDIEVAFDVMFKRFGTNQEGMFTLNLSGNNNTFYGLFFAGGVVELTKIEKGHAILKTTKSTGKPVMQPNTWYALRFVRSGKTLSVFQGQKKSPLLSRIEQNLLPDGVLAFAVGEYATSNDPSLVMCIDNLTVNELANPNLTSSRSLATQREGKGLL